MTKTGLLIRFTLSDFNLTRHIFRYRSTFPLPVKTLVRILKNICVFPIARHDLRQQERQMKVFFFAFKIIRLRTTAKKQGHDGR